MYQIKIFAEENYFQKNNFNLYFENDVVVKGVIAMMFVICDCSDCSVKD